jgi:nitrite reductase/ring-hydroxylating ferredoxin subunit
VTCWRRRDVLSAFGVGIAAAACSSSSKGLPPCVVQDDAGLGHSQAYCLIEREHIRVPNIRTIGVGQAALFNIDDSTAVIVARDAAGAYAMSGICTHQCCLISICSDAACTTIGTNPGECKSTSVGSPAQTGAAMICPCHGSAFSIDGKVLTGPAVRSLPHYALSFEGDDAIVDTSTVVAIDVRV